MYNLAFNSSSLYIAGSRHPQEIQAKSLMLGEWPNEHCLQCLYTIKENNIWGLFNSDNFLVPLSKQELPQLLLFELEYPEVYLDSRWQSHRSRFQLTEEWSFFFIIHCFSNETLCPNYLVRAKGLSSRRCTRVDGAEASLLFHRPPLH